MKYSILKQPDAVIVENNKGEAINASDINIKFIEKENGLRVSVTAEQTPLSYLRLRWNMEMPEQMLYFGDTWERGYGDMEWRYLSATRFMPWYFLMNKANWTLAYGVMVRPGAMCFWQADEAGITLYMDIRNGGNGVVLSGRELEAAVIVEQEYKGLASYEASVEFCRVMCQDPIFPDFPVYGSNNWYYAYGDSSEEEILSDTDYIAELTKGVSNKPYMVIDDCWQENHRLDEYNGGPWTKGNQKFPDMGRLAEKLEEKGVRPGIWVRLLLNEDPVIPQEWRLSHNACLDPSHPEAMKYIKQNVKRICDWGYTLIKHDFSTFDITGKWGFEMNPHVTEEGWNFWDKSKTTAEVIVDLYREILDSAKESNAIILGCNTVGHLGAGLMHMSRTGDDTSGLCWERTRKIGVNTLAFRMPHHKTFYDVDADCVGITGDISWKYNKQWAQAVTRSGSSLFVSAKPGVLTEEENAELSKIFAEASKQEEQAIPLDWQYTDCPSKWKSDKGVYQYQWYEDTGLWFRQKPTRYQTYLSSE